MQPPGLVSTREQVRAASFIGVGVLDVKTIKPVYQWKTAPGSVHLLDWAADGRHLVTHNGNTTGYVLRLNDTGK